MSKTHSPSTKSSGSALHKHSRCLTRCVARTIVACAALAALVGAAVGTNTAAEVPPTGKNKLSLAVATFAEPRTYQRRAVGLRAAAWMQRLLSDAGRWQIAPRDRVIAIERRLRLTPPFQAGDLQRMGAKLGVHLVVSGALGRLRLDHANHAVDVELRVELTDVATGELVEAVNARGRAQAKRDQPLPTDVVVEKALAAACRAACRKLLAPPLVLTHVVKKLGRTEYQLDAGRKAGLAKGRKCLVLRHVGDLLDGVAVVIIRDVADDHSVAVVVASLDAPRAGDVAIAP